MFALYILYTHLIAYISLNKQCVNTLFYYYYCHRRCSMLHPTLRSIHPSHLSNLTYSTTTVLHPSLMCYCVIRVTEISLQGWRSEGCMFRNDNTTEFPKWTQLLQMDLQIKNVTSLYMYKYNRLAQFGACPRQQIFSIFVIKGRMLSFLRHSP